MVGGGVILEWEFKSYLICFVVVGGGYERLDNV